MEAGSRMLSPSQTELSSAVVVNLFKLKASLFRIKSPLGKCQILAFTYFLLEEKEQSNSSAADNLKDNSMSEFFEHYGFLI